MEGTKIENGCYEDTLKVYNTLTEEEKKYIDDGDFKESPFTICRKVLYIKNNPISFVEIIELPEEKNTGYVVVATAPNFRKNGYSKSLVKSVEKEIPKNIERLVWLYDEENTKSSEMASSLGFLKLKNGIMERKIV